MNDPNRKIEIDKSSLLSLKAELLRKQEEVGRARVNSSVEDFVPKKVPKPEKDASEGRKKGSNNRKEKKPRPAVTELEDAAQLARSKQMLQAKAKYYERMVASGGALNTDENSLVMFNKKKQDAKPTHYFSEDSEEHKSDLSDSDSTTDSDSNEDDDNKWVEYTDCLGRTRKCLKKDLPQCMERDRELAKSVEPREGQRREDMDGTTDSTTLPKEPEENLQNIEEQEDGDIIGPMPSMVTAEPDVGERFREMREQWVEQEEANLEKDSIHYQDVLFNEARLHGVGYYAFSTDQQERSRQREELDSIRDSTIEAQREREALRQARDKIIADRVKAARARQRARLGLPPEEEEEENKPTEKTSDQLYETAEERRLKKIEEKERKKREKEERRRERERAQHVRPWDAGKDPNGEEKDWVPAKERFVLSQHEWNDLKRGERIAEFAPPQFDRPSASNDRRREWSQPPWNPAPRACVESDSLESSEDEETIVGPMPPTMGDGSLPVEQQGNLLDDIPLPEEEPSARTLFFTTKKNPPKKELKRRNLNAVETVTSANQPPIPIRNELSDDELSTNTTQEVRGKGAEIEPPPTYDYYGPSGGTGASRKRPATDTQSMLEASIEAGLKFLRNQSDKAGGPGTKNRWSSNADY
ncbi:coiled-coil domain-containing protein 174 [Anopheles ziemanni]|uniref:coiled-coil domain-containing protein 174 n=1 Tax=Anopheles coustani TaxID=139045 RepID=UPI002658379F|nr:coiled-coil domain-containing protein 174 [Anopheles coustani]XP_058175001.1 coiled-coil domain-containing protein 174 [Anopheles ziemanni]